MDLYSILPHALSILYLKTFEIIIVILEESFHLICQHINPIGCYGITFNFNCSDGHIQFLILKFIYSE